MFRRKSRWGIPLTSPTEVTPMRRSSFNLRQGDSATRTARAEAPPRADRAFRGGCLG